jgi:hypothetical protein
MSNVPEQTYDYIFGNFLYFLTSDPTAALKGQSIWLEGRNHLTF